MRRFWQGLAIVAAILVAAIATILIIAQTSWFNGKIVTFVKDKLGRDIEIKGRSSLRLRLAPTLRLPSRPRQSRYGPRHYPPWRVRGFPRQLVGSPRRAQPQVRARTLRRHR